MNFSIISSAHNIIKPIVFLFKCGFCLLSQGTRIYFFVVCYPRPLRTNTVILPVPAMADGSPGIHWNYPQLKRDFLPKVIPPLRGTHPTFNVWQMWGEQGLVPCLKENSLEEIPCGCLRCCSFCVTAQFLPLPTASLPHLSHRCWSSGHHPLYSWKQIGLRVGFSENPPKMLLNINIIYPFL